MPLGETIKYSLLLQGTTGIAVVVFLVLSIILTFLAYRKTLPETSLSKRIILFSLRTIAFFLIFFSLFEPLLVKKGISEIPPSVAVLLDNSASISMSDPEGASLRFDKAGDILKRTYATEFYSFSDSVLSYTGATYDGISTSIGDALIHMRDLNNKGDKSKNIQAIIMISDGQNNLGDDPLSVAARMNTPIYVAGVGNKTQHKNLAIKRIVNNNIAYKDIPTQVFAYVEGWGIDSDVRVSLEHGDSVIAQKIVRPGSKGEQTEVLFEFVPDSLGQNYYTISCPILNDEIIKSDNRRSFSVNVLPSKKQILLLYSSPGWDLTFMKRALEENKNYDVYFSDITGKINTGEKSVSFTGNLSRFDAIFILNTDISTVHCKFIDDYIVGGGSLFLLLGKNNLYCSQFSNTTALSQRIGSWSDDEFIPLLTIDGSRHPIFNFEELSTDVKEGNWASALPPLRGFRILENIKSSARVLLEHPTLEGIPVMLTFESGKSRQIIFNGGNMWRWSFLPFGFGGNNDIYKTILVNSAQWLLSKDEISPFVLNTDQKVYRSGESVYFTANVRDESGNFIEGLTIQLDFNRSYVDSMTNTKKNDKFSFIMEESGGGFYSLRVSALNTGDFVVTGNILESELVPVSKKHSSFRIEPYSAEFSDLRENKDILEKIAELSGGEYITLENMEDFLGNLKLKPQILNVKEEIPLWDKLWLLLLILLMLSIEWFIRKRANLP